MSSTTNIAQAASQANDIRDIKPPIEIPNYWMLLWWALGALVVGGLIAAVLVRFLRRRALAAMTPTIPAHVRARQRLEEALAVLSQPKVFCTMVSDTVRIYLEERFNFRAPERTTEEFLHELSGTNLLIPDQKDSLGNFLQSCDMVKFARYEPGEPELLGLHNSALQLVEETKPRLALNVESGNRENEKAEIMADSR